ncbi:MAG: TolC family protein [bacterium]|nr:TolC family protein [bacterium]
MRIVILLLIVVTGLLGLNNTPLAAGNEEGAKQVQHFTLQQVREYAVKHSTSTTNAGLDVKKAKKKIWETTATGLPQVEGKIAYRNMLKLPVTLVPADVFDKDAEPGEIAEMTFGVQHNATLELTATQLVFSGSYIVALQASKTYLKLAKNSLVKSEIDVKATVSDTYYLILLAEDSFKKLSASLDNLNKTLEETKELYKAGFVEDTDVDQVLLAVTDLENAVNSMKRQVKITYRLLNFQMGLPLDKKIRLADTLGTIMERLESKTLLNQSFDLTSHIDYRLLKTQEKAQSLLYKRAKTDFLPTISAFANHQQMAGRESFNFFDKERWFSSTTIGLNIQVPIFSSGMRLAQVAQAKIDLKKAVNDKLEASKGLNLELQQAQSLFKDSMDTEAKTRTNVSLAKRIYEKNKTKYKEGMCSSLDLIQIHNQYLSAETNYTKAAVDLLKAKTRLEKILSRL